MDDDDQPCTGCGLEEPIFLHHFPDRYHGTYEILCTSCVLKNNLTKYCIRCFKRIAEETAMSNNQLHATCRNCPAKVHLACIPESVRFASSVSYLCPRCSDPSSFKFFDLKAAQDFLSEGYFSLIDQLRCASKISELALVPVHEAIMAREKEQARQESAAATERANKNMSKFFKYEQVLQIEREQQQAQNSEDMDAGNVDEDAGEDDGAAQY